MSALLWKKHGYLSTKAGIIDWSEFIYIPTLELDVHNKYNFPGNKFM